MPSETECRGCRPRLAHVGLLCRWCFQRLRLDIATAPTLVEHLRLVAEPDAGAAPPSDGRSHTDRAESNMLSAAVDAADEIHAVLASWAQYVVDTFPSPIKGPSQVGWWRSEWTVAVDPVTGEVYDRPSQPKGVREPRATGELARWFEPYMTWIVKQPWAGEMRSELASLIGTTKARWPMAERSRPVPYAPCPDCDRTSLVYHPPAHEGAQVQVACSHRECGAVLDERAWSWAVQRIEYERAREKRRTVK